MAWTAPTTRSSGALITASIWNTDLVDNLAYLKASPVIDTAVVLGAATTSGIRLDLESGTLAVREGDDSAYGPINSGTVTVTGAVSPASNDVGALGSGSVAWSDLFLASGGVINFANGDVTVTHASDTLTVAGGVTVLNGSAKVQADGDGYAVNIIGRSSDSRSEIRFLNNAYTTEYAMLLADPTRLFIYALQSGSDLVFGTANTFRAKLNSAGEFTIGYGDTDNGAYLLQVNSQIFATNATIATSDGRYKENVQPVTRGLEMVSALRPVQFTWKADPVHNFIPGVDVGFIAQDVQAALRGQDYCGTVVTENGDGDDAFLGMADSKLIPILVSALQELDGKVTALEAQINKER